MIDSSWKLSPQWTRDDASLSAGLLHCTTCRAQSCAHIWINLSLPLLSSAFDL